MQEKEDSGCRKISHKEEFDYLYSSPNISKIFKLGKMRLSGYVAGVGKRRYANSVLMGKSEGKSL
jgi:hypothetical protein